MAEGRASQSANSIADGVYPLPGYTRRKVAGTTLVATDVTVDILATIVARHGTLYDWAGSQRQARALRGRAPVFLAAIPESTNTTVVVRHSWHGGLLAPLTRDRFRRPTRAPIELLRSVMLRECGIATPEVVAFALYNAGPGFARVDVATRYIPESHDFAAVLARLAPNIAREEAFAAVERLLHQLARNGFTHPDLNVKNILLQKKGANVQAWVLDVDVMRWKRQVPAASIMKRNAERLLRSLAKARRQFGIVFDDAERDAFRRRMIDGVPADYPGMQQAPDVPPGSLPL